MLWFHQDMPRTVGANMSYIFFNPFVTTVHFIDTFEFCPFWDNCTVYWYYLYMRGLPGHVTVLEISWRQIAPHTARAMTHKVGNSYVMKI